MAVDSAIQLSTSGLVTYSDGSSWGTRDDSYTIGTWVYYSGHGGICFGVYRNTNTQPTFGWGAGRPTSVASTNNLYVGVRVE